MRRGNNRYVLELYLELDCDGATTSGRGGARQEGKGSRTRPGAGGCTPLTTQQSGTPRQQSDTATSRAKGDDDQERQQANLKEERDKTTWNCEGSHTLNEGSHTFNEIRRKRKKKHRHGVIGSRTRLEEVIPEKGRCHRAAQARDTRAFR